MKTTSPKPLLLQAHHITDLYCWIDTLVPASAPAPTGRPLSLTDSEVITILVWNALVLRQKTLKDLHRFATLYHANDFRMPKYSCFVERCHAALPKAQDFLMLLLETEAPVRIMDSTMLPVCKLARADDHKVAKKLARFGKNWQGWHYGLKLHASIDLEGKLAGLALTGANIYDAQAMPMILNKHCKLAVGDTLYGAKVMGKKIRKAYGTVIIAPAFPKQNKKIAAGWEFKLLDLRSKIESVFDYLKEHMHLVSSFPRSIEGYVLHYVRVLLGYQVMALLSR
jgi:hypothetical protein